MTAWNFDHCPDRRGTGSMKWQRWAGQEVIPAWVADMDALAPATVLEALRARIEHGVLGYSVPQRSFAESACAWLATRHGWTVEPDAIVPLPGVVTGFNMFCRAIGAPGDGHLCPIPCYPPFLSAPGNQGQRLLRVDLAQEASGWRLDQAALDAATDATTRSLLFCHPHNPTGRVWTDAELAAWAEHCRRHDLWVLSDEIWADLVLDGRHRPFVCAAPDLAARTVTLYAPSKTFNLPGLCCAIAIIPDADLRKRFRAAGAGIVPSAEGLGMLGAETAWRTGGPWLDALLDHLRRNRDLVRATLARLPRLKWQPGQATYLAWIDAQQSGVADPAAHAVAHGVGLSDGRDFAAPGWLRLNFGCPRATLETALERLARAFG